MAGSGAREEIRLRHLLLDTNVVLDLVPGREPWLTEP
jgi:hypothetical protein